MAAEIEIDGEPFEIPMLASFDLDEEQILFDQTGLTSPDFMAADPDTDDDEQKAHNDRVMQAIKSPGFRVAHVMVAYRRKHRDIPADEIRRLAGAVKGIDAWVNLITQSMEADTSPLVRTTGQPEQSENETPEKNGSSGSSSENDSGSSVDQPTPIGATR